VINKDFHFELLPEVDATDGAAFGIGLHMGLDENGFAPGSTDWAVQDSENSQNGSTAFGRDRLLGPVWSWQLHVNRSSTAEALETLRAFKKAWTAMHIRDVPGKVIPLRFQLEGEQRRIYGRPRRFEAPPDNRILGGYVPVSIDFKCTDGFVYSDTMESVTLRLGQGIEDEGADSGGGFVFPVTWPVTPMPPTRQQSVVLIEGDEPAYPIIRFDGPVFNPGFIYEDWRLDFDYNLPAGQYIEVDTRPWVNTILLNGNASIAGKIGARQRLSKMRLTPGRFNARFVGSSDGSATCTVRWASTHNSY